MIIDHVKNWEMSPGAVDRRSNEVGTLSYFAGGLHFVKGGTDRLIQSGFDSPSRPGRWQAGGCAAWNSFAAVRSAGICLTEHYQRCQQLRGCLFDRSPTGSLFVAF